MANSHGFAPLPAAANASDLPQVRALLDAGAFTQPDLDLALARAVLRFHERREIAQRLLDRGADPNGQYGGNYGPILFAPCETLDPDGIQFLLDAGADASFPPISTKYGPQAPLGHVLGTYARGVNPRKHRCIDILLAHHAQVPPEVTPPFLAIHRGDANALATELDRDPHLATAHFPAMPYGNIPLAGATLLHCAVEFGELECLDLLVARGADLNARTIPPIENQKSKIKNEQGPTPIFHAIASVAGANFYTLEHLLARYRDRIDLSLPATFDAPEWTTIHNLTPLEFAALADTPQTPPYRKISAKELALLRASA